MERSDKATVGHERLQLSFGPGGKGRVEAEVSDLLAARKRPSCLLDGKHGFSSSGRANNKHALVVLEHVEATELLPC